MTQRYLSINEDQSLSITLGSTMFFFHFYPFRKLMYMDIKQDNEYLVAGKRVMANQWLIPIYMGEDVGNVRFETYTADGDDYVWWEDFNKKFRLMLYSSNEIKEMEAVE